jgi:hypothetical protein
MIKKNKIDRTALKFNQGSIVLLTGLAFLLDIPWLAAFVAAVLLIDTIIPGTGLFKLLYKHIVKPSGLLKPDPAEESPAPHRFAQGLGGIFLTAAFICLQIFSLTALGWILSLIVVALAFINLTLNFCAGCFLYFQIQRLRSPSASDLSGSENA